MPIVDLQLVVPDARAIEAGLARAFAAAGRATGGRSPRYPDRAHHLSRGIGRRAGYQRRSHQVRCPWQGTHCYWGRIFEIKRHQMLFQPP